MTTKFVGQRIETESIILNGILKTNMMVGGAGGGVVSQIGALSCGFCIKSVAS